MKILFFTIIISLLCSCSSGKIDYLKFKDSQDYHVPLFDDSYKNRTALFIFPHPDDEIVCAGTIAQLKKSGWTIHLLTLTQGQAAEKIIRKTEWNKAVRELGFDKYEILDLPNNSWDNVISNNITFWYDNIDSIERIIYNSIVKYEPSLLFTYDSALGAYGHPEHRISALAAYNVFNKYRTDAKFTVETILQITLPEKEEQLMLSNAESYKNAIKYTGNKTLPNPTIAFNIFKYWGAKRNAALQYKSQAKTLKKFFLLPETRDTTDHYKTFDREYYFEINR